MFTLLKIDALEVVRDTNNNNSVMKLSLSGFGKSMMQESSGSVEYDLSENLGYYNRAFCSNRVKSEQLNNHSNIVVVSSWNVCSYVIPALKMSTL